jgi:transposase
VDTRLSGLLPRKKTMKTNQTYTPEFRAEAVKLVLEQGLSQGEAATKLGIPKGSLGNWVSDARRRKQDQTAAGEPTRDELKAEVARLRKELARVEMEREIVKKAAAYFAKESLQGTRS